ncbi:hypothetical protein [Nocardiopsis chromatogenes]|uniref:hypothetical protein n=1 Tax=Nocardiopsis chromatogenes TaxID=280239 RepID=UPI00034B9A63|nr:hypothetical protein [Nocardiopsis chromatogenes]
MDELQKIFARLFESRLEGGPPGPDTTVFGPDSTYALESMETLRFVSELLPLYGDSVYDLKVEELTTLRSVHEQLGGA